MGTAPNTDNYTLGRGKILFNRRNPDGSYQGMRDLGNAPDFSVSISVDKLDHKSSRTGASVKDKTVVVGMNPVASFTIDEINVENLAMVFMAGVTAQSQLTDDDVTKAFTEVEEGIYYDLDKRDVGVWQISHGSVTGGPFQLDETITGGSSAATAVVTRVDATKLCIKTISGTFEADETITGGTSSASATTSDVAVFNTEDLVVSQSSTFFAAGTDFSVESRAGKIFILPGSTLAAATSTDVGFGCKAASYKELNAFAESSVEGELHFISDVAEGTNADAYLWSVNLSPAGEYSFISGSDEWNSMEFECEINKDTSKPLYPYIKIVV